MHVRIICFQTCQWSIFRENSSPSWKEKENAGLPEDFDFGTGRGDCLGSLKRSGEFMLITSGERGVERGDVVFDGTLATSAPML
jgi:hypothetical protein